MTIPAELSCHELATLLGVSHNHINYRCKIGSIPAVRMNPDPKKKKSKWIIPLAQLRTSCPELWESIVLRSQLMESE